MDLVAHHSSHKVGNFDDRLWGDSMILVILEDWRHEYNHERLHSSLCYLTPVEFKELWMQQNQQRLSVALDH